MKKIISILLAVMLVVSVAVVSFGAVSYAPTDSYTVDKNTPYTEEAIVACGGSLAETMTIYFQAPEDWANKFNTFPGPDLENKEPYMHVCIYWWEGIAGVADKPWSWPNGKGCTWVGYQAHLIDKENRIYSAKVPNVAEPITPLVTWNNGVNAGMDETADIFKYGRQIADTSVEGAWDGDMLTLPEGCPAFAADPDKYYDDIDGEFALGMDGCISIINYDEKRATVNSLTGFLNYSSDWYVYYGKGCYGEYPTFSNNYHGRTASCINPEHEHSAPGDVNKDKAVDINDVISYQNYLADLPELEGKPFDLDNADVDDDGYISIIDASRIQRYLAGLCTIDGKKA